MQLSKAEPACDPVRSDLLSDVLQDLRLAHATYCRCELGAPWGIALPFQEGVRFHFMVEGRCWMRSGSHPPLLLEEGDVVLLPHGTAHAIVNAPDQRPKRIGTLKPQLIGNGIYRLAAGGSGERARVVCCTIGFDGPTAHPLVELLPDVLHLRRAELSDPSLPSLLAMMAEEVQTPRIGSATIMARLADIAMTRIVRTWVESRPADLTGWLAAVQDPQIGLALARIHREPGRDWSVEALAAVAGISRSKFSERFTQLLDTSPARYLLQWRMRLATAWLRSGAMTISQVAAELGYESDAAFSRAFKRFMGVSPGAARSLAA
jgi:AraC-like DNA-binding protein